MKVKHASRLGSTQISADGEGLVARAGTALVGEPAHRIGLDRELSSAKALGYDSPVASGCNGRRRRRAKGPLSSRPIVEVIRVTDAQLRARGPAALRLGKCSERDGSDAA